MFTPTNEKTVNLDLKRIDICDLLIACDVAADISGAEKWNTLHNKLYEILDNFDRAEGIRID